MSVRSSEEQSHAQAAHPRQRCPRPPAPPSAPSGERSPAKRGLNQAGPTPRWCGRGSRHRLTERAVEAAGSARPHAVLLQRCQRGRLRARRGSEAGASPDAHPRFRTPPAPRERGPSAGGHTPYNCERSNARLAPSRGPDCPVPSCLRRLRAPGCRPNRKRTDSRSGPACKSRSQPLRTARRCTPTVRPPVLRSPLTSWPVPSSSGRPPTPPPTCAPLYSP